MGNKKTAPKKAEKKTSNNFENVKKIVTNSNHDFAGRRAIVQDVFSLALGHPITKSMDIDRTLLNADFEQKMTHIEEITAGQDYNIRENIRDLSRILLSPVKAEKGGKKKIVEKKSEPVLVVKQTGIKELRVQALKMVLAQTARSRPVEVQEVSKLSPKGAEVQEFFNENKGAFGCQTALVARTISAHLNETIHSKKSNEDDESFENFMAFGCVEWEGDTYLVVSNRVAITSDGGAMHLDDENIDGPSSDEHVKAFIASMSESELRATFSFLDLK